MSAAQARELPTFDGRLSASNAELLLSFLTVPYIRIPLVLNFFASAEVCRPLRGAAFAIIALI